MTSSAVFRVLLSVVLVSAAVAQNNGSSCKATVPVPKSIVGRTFSMADDCYRPRSSTSVSIYKKMFILTINDGIPLQCPETYLLVYRKPELTPMLVKYAKVDVDLSALGGSASGDDVTKYCESMAKKNKQEMFPVTETKPKFVAAVKKMLPILREVRDFGCTTNEDGFVQQVQGRAYDNADLEAVIAYLYSVAYRYGLCV